jgi:hypothetical protein
MLMIRKISRAALVLAAFGALAAPAALASSDPYMSPLYANTAGADGGCDGLLNGSASQSGGTIVGFTTVVPQDDGTVLVQVHLKNAEPNTTYLFTRACIASPFAYLTTNSKGVGNGTLVAPENGSAWVINGGPAPLSINTFGADFFASNVITFPNHGS